MARNVEPKIRTLELDDLERVLAWAGREGWNPGLHDAQAFMAADPQGFLGAFLDGRLVGSISMVVYDHAYAFGGLYLVEPSLRGRGIGRALGQIALARAGDRVVGLDGVVAQQETYRALGFEMAFTSLRCLGKGGGPDPGGAVALGQADLTLVEALDRRCFPALRPEFLRRWITYPEGVALGVMEAGELVGYGLMRPCRQGRKIGPLFAADPHVAKLLFQALRARAVPGEPVYLDVPQNNPQAVALAGDLGLEPGFQCGRMYRNGRPPWQAEHVYGITTFELG